MCLGSCLVAQDFVDENLQAEMAEVEKWMTLLNQAELHYIDMSEYPTELSRYQLIITEQLETYMMIIEDAEIKNFDGEDVSGDLTKANSILDKLKEYKFIFDDYVAYKATENSKTMLKFAVVSVNSGKPQRRIKLEAYNATVGMAPIKKDKVARRIGSMNKYVYSDGSNVYFLNGRLYQVGGTVGLMGRNFQK